MKYMRGVCISMHDKPDDWQDYKEGIWLKVEDKIKVSGTIRAAIRMAPDELVITKDCLGLFNIT